MPRRLALVIHALNSGGAERVLARLASHWATAGRDVTLITLAETGTDRYPLDPRVRRVGLGLLQPSRSAWDALRNNYRRLRRLRRAIRDSRAEAVVSFTDQINVLTLLACLGRPWPVVIAERNDPRRQRMSPLWERLRRWMYPTCAAAVVQTEAVASCVRGLVGRRPVHVIPNAVAPPQSPGTPDGEIPGARSFVAAMGRLDVQKGFDLLIDAFARIAGEHPAMDLQIIGKGPERERLEKLASERGLGSRVLFPGWLEHPEPVLQAATLFVLASRWEGFPNALLEAMACGLPVVSFDCDSGPREIVRHGIDGLLVPPEDVGALAAAMDRLARDGPGRQAMGQHARQVVARFGYDDFFARWDEVMRTLDSG